MNAVFLPVSAYSPYAEDVPEEEVKTEPCATSPSSFADEYSPSCHPLEKKAPAQGVSEYASDASSAIPSAYTSDVLEEQQKPEAGACPAWQVTPAPLTPEDARVLSCHVLKEVELAREFPEHATRARNDVFIGWLLEKGVPFASLGRVYIFHQQGKEFHLKNDRFGEGMFFRDWQVIFGSLPQKVELVDYEKRFTLNLSGENQLQSPYEAVAIHLPDGWRVMDAALLPEILTIEEWKEKLQGSKAVVAVSALAEMPELVVSSLPERPKERLRRILAIEKHMPWEPERVSAIVREMPLSMRLDMYADILEFREAHPLHPPRWKPDSPGGDELHPWQLSENQERLDKAQQELQPLLTFTRFWASQKNDEAMLQQIREQMERGSKRKDRVEFDLKTLHID